MVYLIGILGFIGGFVFGQIVLHYLLRDKTRQELLNDKYLKWKFGLLNWGLAALGSYSFILVYRVYFG
jgi:hypothetical protein